MKFLSIKHLCVIFATLLFSQFALASGSYTQAAAPQDDIVDTAALAGSFNTLATALIEADLVSTLKGDGPFTVFAPTDEAFNKLPADQLNAILADKELLRSILTYHVVAGTVMAKELVTMSSATSLQGEELEVDVSGGVTVAGANVIKADILTTNGVIHVVDTVLIPNSKSEGAAD